MRAGLKKASSSHLLNLRSRPCEKMSQLPKAEDHRTADHPLVPLIVQRWSPRAMSGEGITGEEMLTLFEAARWAPSTWNYQEQ